MINKNEVPTVGFVGGAWIIDWWQHWIEPGLQQVLLVITVLTAMVLLARNVLDLLVKFREWKAKARSQPNNPPI
nr:hypothetical protein [uncultured Cohaesibacter sp.]